MTSEHPDHSRRSLLRLGATAGAGLVGAWALGATDLVQAAASALPSSSARLADAAVTGCATLTPEETQGPYWVDERLFRSDIRTDTATSTVQPGVPLTLTLTLTDAGAGCAPQAGAYVDLWHCNASGAYSDVSGNGQADTVGHDWLRGYQVSDANGQVTFTTIWPGYYSGRTIHIHFRVRTSLSDGSAVNFTSQLYFDEAANAAVLATSSYQRATARDTTNATDGIFDTQMLVPVTGSAAAGYSGAFTINLDFGDGTSSGGTSSGSSTVGATLGSVRVVRRAGRRVVHAHVVNTEQMVVRYRLLRGDDVLAGRRTGWLVPGTRTLGLVVPRAVTAGRARVQLKMTDTGGNTKFTSAVVHVPHR